MSAASVRAQRVHSPWRSDEEPSISLENCWYSRICAESETAALGVQSTIFLKRSLDDPKRNFLDLGGAQNSLSTSRVIPIGSYR